MAEDRPRASRTEVDESVRALRAYYEAGRTSLREVPARAANAVEAIREQAARRGWADTKLRKARQFANLFTREELNELCRAVRQHRAHFGTASLGIIVTIPDARQRRDLLRRCLKGGMGIRALQREVRMRFDRRTFGGRRRQVADDPTLALVQLDELAVSWLRWHAIAAEEPEGNGRSKSVLDRLPDAVAAEALKVHRAMLRLYAAVAKELKRARARGQRTGSR
jgi:hypothetical protein